MFKSKVEQIKLELAKDAGKCAVLYEAADESEKSMFKFMLDGAYANALGRLSLLFMKEDSFEGRNELFTEIVNLIPPYQDKSLLSIHRSAINEAGDCLYRWAKNHTARSKPTEQHYRNAVVGSFSTIIPFQDYELAGIEVALSDNDRDRIDILARCIESNRDVIIELKLGSKSAHKQLRSYAVHYDNPIMINVTENTVKNQRHDIKYFTFNELGIEVTL